MWIFLFCGWYFLILSGFVDSKYNGSIVVLKFGKQLIAVREKNCKGAICYVYFDQHYLTEYKRLDLLMQSLK